MGKLSNYPEAVATRELNGADFCGQTVGSVLELSKMGKPTNLQDLRNRIDAYFSFCSERNFRPGVETLALSLGISRVCLWKWCNREDEWGEACRTARQCIIGFVESAAMSGHLSPPIAIFTLKNVGGWRDTVSFEDATPGTDETKALDTYSWRQRFLSDREGRDALETANVVELLPIAE